MDYETAKECSDLLSKIQIMTLENVIKIADKYNINRDELLKKFATMFGVMVELGTFKEYEIKEDI